MKTFFAFFAVLAVAATVLCVHAIKGVFNEREVRLRMENSETELRLRIDMNKWGVRRQEKNKGTGL
tara:strand:- start:245 stop:442 length:198 start_codon:yes stop_codon:yes gene_type:complete